MKIVNNMNMKIAKVLTFSFLSVFLIACADDDDTSVTPDTTINPNEEELITTVRLEFIDMNNNSSTFEFSDPDGEGGNPPTIDTLKLNLNEVYLVSAKFLDESDPNDVEDITEEIEEEDDEHIICFETTNINGLSIQRTDSDGTYEIGLESRWVVADTANASNGTVRLSLKHQPGVKDGTCAPGDTDVEIDFPLLLN